MTFLARPSRRLFVFTSRSSKVVGIFGETKSVKTSNLGQLGKFYNRINAKFRFLIPIILLSNRRGG
jgi:hypothetical protein